MKTLREKQAAFLVMVSKLISYACGQGITLFVLEWYRTPERQKQLVADKKSWTMNSKHLSGEAVDLCVLKDGKVSWQAEDYQPLAEYWEKIGGTAGYFWKVVAGDYASSQKAEAQYKIAQAAKNKFNTGFATLEQVIAEYQKVINNYPGTDYAAKATQEIAQLYATHSTIEHKLLAIQYYTDLLKQIDPFSSQAEGTLTTIGNLELEILREQGKIVEGLALPPLTRQNAARKVLENRRATYLSTAKGTESALGKADGMKLEEAVSYLNTLDAQVTAEIAHARIMVKKGQVYEKESKITEAINTYLYLIDEYPNASTQVDFAKKRIGFYNSSMASGAALSQFTEDYVTILNYNKLLMQEKQTNPAKFHLDVARRFEAANDLPSALREYQQVCTDYKGTPEQEEAKKKVADIYTAMGRPDKGAAFLKSLETK